MIVESMYPIFLILEFESFLPYYVLVVVLFLLALLGLYAGWYLLKKNFNNKVQQQYEEFQRKSLIEKERMRIAMDLHDDIGASLTALSLITSLLNDVEVEERGKGLIKKVNEVSGKMVQDMNEIVWALNATNDTLPNLMAYTRQTISNLLFNADVAFEESEPIKYPKIFVSGTTRRHVFIIIKELVNNAIKHSGSKRLKVGVTVNDRLSVTIVDFGVGIADPKFSVISNGGNGLNNMKRRIQDLGGEITFKNENGLTVNFSIPLSKFQQTD